MEFLVDDVDVEYQKLQGWVATFVNEPTTMPWGNRSLLFRDPDGNLVNLFTPVTDVRSRTTPLTPDDSGWVKRGVSTFEKQH